MKRRFLVSKRIREEFENGRLYYDVDGREVQLPVKRELAPSRESLDWHASNVLRRWERTSPDRIRRETRLR